MGVIGGMNEWGFLSPSSLYDERRNPSVIDEPPCVTAKPDPAFPSIHNAFLLRTAIRPTAAGLFGASGGTPSCGIHGQYAEHTILVSDA
jgi:hypothetical protein